MSIRSIVLRRKINSLARRLGWTYAPARPVRAWISPTTICNLRCRTCGRFISEIPFRHMSEETYSIVRREIMPGLGSVILTGVGEPLLAPLLPAMLSDCQQRGIHIELTTNGSVWSEDVFHRLARMGARVIVSVDGAEAGTIEFVRSGLKFAVLCETLDHLSRLKGERLNPAFELYFNVVLLEMNLGELEGIVEWAARLGVDCVYFSSFSATGHTEDFARQSLESRPGVVNPILDKACALCAQKGIRAVRPQFLSGAAGETKRGGAGRLLQCPLPWWAVYIETDGSVLPCCQWWPPVGNLHDAPFGRIWNGPAYRAIRRAVNALPLPGPCQRCILGERTL